MAKRQYAKGRHALAECQRSGQKMRYRDLVEDGHIEGLLVHPDWWEPKHPQETPVDVTDPVALYRPAPEISIEAGYGDPENLDGGTTPTEPHCIINDDFNREGPELGDDWVDPILFAPGNNWNETYDLPVIHDNSWAGPTGLGPSSVAGSCFAIHTQQMARSKPAFVEYVISDVWNPGYYGAGLWVPLRFYTDYVDVENSHGYYGYIGSSDYSGYSGSYMNISRWDNGRKYSTVGVPPVPTFESLGDLAGDTIRFEMIGDRILGYHNGTLWTTAVDSTHQDGRHVGIATDHYYAGQIGGYQSFKAGYMEITEGTLAQTVNAGDTRALFSIATKMQPWGEWIFIELDGGGYHVSRITNGFASSGSAEPVFFVDFTTPMPVGSVATAGNTFMMRESIVQ